MVFGRYRSVRYAMAGRIISFAVAVAGGAGGCGGSRVVLLWLLVSSRPRRLNNS
jgi:hypothetical protein